MNFVYVEYPSSVPRRDGYRPMDVIDNVVSVPMRICYEHGQNPDLYELLQYNEAAKRAACPHARMQNIGDESGRAGYRICLDCRATYV